MASISQRPLLSELGDTLHRQLMAYFVCKDFPCKSSCILGGPVEDGMAVIKWWLRARR